MYHDIYTLGKKVARPLETRVEEMYTRAQKTLMDSAKMAKLGLSDLGKDQALQEASGTGNISKTHTGTAE